VISDTHGLLRPEALEALRGAELIVHAGDVGDAAILDALRELAPLYAVRGNVDRGAWAMRLPRSELLEVGACTLLVHHGHEALDLDPAAAGCRVVVSGHSHQPEVEERGGVLFLNPGSAGPKRFRLPVTLARLYVPEGAPDGVRAELIDLE
jgi:putative phosphoesterase